jgi:2-polyprenyl-6-methoxyphenol hydroxylase-like FAD-dependent oxidoreductase
VFPRDGGKVRLYQNFSIRQKGRFSGPERVRELLDSFRLSCLPVGESIAASAPAGPAAFYPWNDSWTDTPCAPGVVLIGDAAGWSDPIIGQGLSIALRDARTVVDAVRLSDDWSQVVFDNYKTERAERMRRLRISAAIDTAMRCTFSEQGRRRRRTFTEALANDPLVAAATLVPNFAGPEAAPAEAFERENTDRILAFA